MTLTNWELHYCTISSAPQILIVAKYKEQEISTHQTKSTKHKKIMQIVHLHPCLQAHPNSQQHIYKILLSEENLSYSCKLIFNSLPCPPTPCYYLHSISHCTHIHPKTYQLPPGTRAHRIVQDLPSKLLYSTDQDLEHHTNKDVSIFWKMDEFQEDPFLTTII
jgi:hypothetical protein